MVFLYALLASAKPTWNPSSRVLNHAVLDSCFVRPGRALGDYIRIVIPDKVVRRIESYPTSGWARNRQGQERARGPEARGKCKYSVVEAKVDDQQQYRVSWL
jgi:hypothetical protein